MYLCNCGDSVVLDVTDARFNTQPLMSFIQPFDKCVRFISSNIPYNFSALHRLSADKSSGFVQRISIFNRKTLFDKCNYVDWASNSFFKMCPTNCRTVADKCSPYLARNNYRHENRSSALVLAPQMDNIHFENLAFRSSANCAFIVNVY